MTLPLTHYDTPLVQADALAKTVAKQLQTAIDQKSKATLVVPGGTTPGPFLTALSLQDIDWSKVTVTLSDERWVPTSSERSNFGLLQRTLGQNNAAVATFLPLYSATATPEDGITDVQQTLAPCLPIDVCVVGMGDDMHTASLFPNATGLEEALSDTATGPLLPIRPQDSDEIRVTLTAPVFKAASFLHVLIKGTNKLDAVQKAAAEPSLVKAPIRLILQHPSTIIHYAP